MAKHIPCRLSICCPCNYVPTERMQQLRNSRRKFLACDRNDSSLVQMQRGEDWKVGITVGAQNGYASVEVDRMPLCA